MFEGLEDDDFSGGNESFMPKKSIKKLVIRKGNSNSSSPSRASSVLGESENQSINEPEATQNGNSLWVNYIVSYWGILIFLETSYWYVNECLSYILIFFQLFTWPTGKGTDSPRGSYSTKIKYWKLWWHHISTECTKTCSNNVKISWWHWSQSESNSRWKRWETCKSSYCLKQY